MIEIEIYKFGCEYGLNKVPEAIRPFIEEFLKEHGGHRKSYEIPERGMSEIFYFFETPPNVILPWEKLEKKLGIKIKIVVEDTFLIFLLKGCDSELFDDEDHFFL